MLAQNEQCSTGSFPKEDPPRMGTQHNNPDSQKKGWWSRRIVQTISQNISEPLFINYSPSF